MNRPNKTPGANGRRGFESARAAALHALYGTARTSGRLPPFGREVERTLRSNPHLSVKLYCGPDAWDRAAQRRHTFGPGTALLLPVGDDPETYRWPPIPELLANIAALPGDTLQKLARALVRDGVRLAYLIDLEHFERSLRVVARGWRP